MFPPVCGDPEGHHEAVVPKMHTVEEQRHEVKAVQRCGLPRPELRRGLRHESPADAALARAATHDPRWHRLETPRIVAGRHAHQHLLNDAAIQGIGLGHRLEGRQRDFASARTRGRCMATFRPPRTTSLGTVPAREAWRSA